jgi:hypothetical protein
MDGRRHEGRAVSQHDYGFGIRYTRPGERWFDTRRIDVREPGEIEFWAKFFGVEDRTLLVAIDKVGTEAIRVKQYLKQHPRLH